MDPCRAGEGFSFWFGYVVKTRSAWCIRSHRPVGSGLCGLTSRWPAVLRPFPSPSAARTPWCASSARGRLTTDTAVRLATNDGSPCRRRARRPVGATVRPGEALDVDPGRPCEDVRVAAPWSVGARAPEPSKQPKVDEPGQAPLGGPQLSIDVQRRQLGGDDVGTEEPLQEVLLSSGQPCPDGASAHRA